MLVILVGRRSVRTLALLSLWCDEAKISSKDQAGPLENFLPHLSLLMMRHCQDSLNSSWSMVHGRNSIKCKGVI